MNLTEALAGVAAHGYNHRAPRSQPAQEHLLEVRRQLPSLLPVGLLVLVSGSGQSLPRVPWIAILNPDVTRTAQQGLYVVYLYSADLSQVALSMNQGATQHRQHFEDQGLSGKAAEDAAIIELERETAALRHALPASSLAGLAEDIDLRSRGFLPTAYEAGNIAAVIYDTASLPPEDQLIADLHRFLTLYEQCVAAKNDLNVAQPGLLHTSAGQKKAGQPISSEPIFRPKDASDYVASVRAHRQVRTRRHEALIKEFGEYQQQRSRIVATNVHPRDLEVITSTDTWLVEAKIVGPNAEYAVRDAIGQLFSYRHFFYRERGIPDPFLVALFSEPIGDAFVALLESLVIAAVWRERGSWRGSPLATTWNLCSPSGTGPSPAPYPSRISRCSGHVDRSL